MLKKNIRKIELKHVESSEIEYSDYFIKEFFEEYSK